MPSKAVFDVATIRDAVQARSDATSLHATAAEIGMSYTGLRGFLTGGNPHPRTRKKLVDWYIESRRTGMARRQRITSHDVDSALELLVRYVKDDGRAEVRARRVHEIIRRFQAETAPSD